MTKKYLDSTGLSYFFNRIKSIFVDSSGDTITGQLEFESGTAPKIKIKDTSLDVTETPENDVYHREIIITDANDVNLGFFQSSQGSNGDRHVTFGIDDPLGESAGQNQVMLGYESNSTPTVWLSQRVAWIEALTGNGNPLDVSHGGTGKTTHTSNAILTGNGTSAVNNVATASGALYATAANGAASFGTLPVGQGGTGKTTNTANAILAGNGTSAIKNIATASGAFYATAANGAASFGTLPVAQGGTGNTGISSVTTLANVITTNSNATISAASYQSWGKVAMVQLTFKLASALSANSTVGIGTIVSGKRPKVAASGGYNTIAAYISTAGAVSVRNISGASIAASTTCYACFTYLIA